VLFFNKHNLFSDLKDVEKKAKNKKAQLKLLASYDPDGDVIIKDPYYVCTVPKIGCQICIGI